MAPRTIPPLKKRKRGVAGGTKPIDVVTKATTEPPTTTEEPSATEQNPDENEESEEEESEEEEKEEEEKEEEEKEEEEKEEEEKEEEGNVTGGESSNDSSKTLGEEYSSDKNMNDETAVENQVEIPASMNQEEIDQEKDGDPIEKDGVQEKDGDQEEDGVPKEKDQEKDGVPKEKDPKEKEKDPKEKDGAGWSGQLTLELVDYGSSRVKRCLGQKLGEYNSTELMRMLPPGPTVRWSVEDGEDELDRTDQSSNGIGRSSDGTGRTDRSSDGMDREKYSRKHKDKCIRTHPRVAHGCNLTGKGRKHQEWVRNVIHHIGSISRLPSCIYLLSHGETDRRSVRPNGDSMDNQRESPRWKPMDKTDVGHASKPKADGRRISWASLR
ncbi:hypothetical protein ISN44_As03g031220 [Arabidopsis suecica]|uniref:Uncharacterized protein n=1 Tax=Arabidopsis suecica TaxID=45249 RepID=A0A8T2FAS2_ARASU|nr:hypothetical protein ISN44_As03g031220 [Arabidopsis suecica]